MAYASISMQKLILLANIRKRGVGNRPCESGQNDITKVRTFAIIGISAASLMSIPRC